MDTTATLEPQRTQIDAGQVGTVVLTVRNDSEIVEEYSFEVVGDLAQHCTVEPVHVSVFPGQEATAVLTIRPPRSADVPAGEHYYGVHVLPAKQAGDATVPEGTVEVLPFHDTAAELSPQTSRSKRGSRYRVAVENRGNVPVAVALAAKSASDELGVTLGEPELTVAPGATASTEIRAEPVERLWRGVPVVYPFTVSVRPDEGPELALAGTQYQEPVLPSWGSRGLVGLLALVAALVLGVWTAVAGDFPPWVEAGNSPSSPPRTAEPTGNPTGDPTEEPTPDPTEEPTADPTEEPTDDPTEEPMEDPTVDSDTVELPAGMLGQPAQPFIDEIRLLGVNITLYEEPTADFAPGIVLRTVPEGGTTVRVGDTVEMWVSVAPPVETFPVPIQLSAPLAETDERSWPEDPSEYTYIITGITLENPQGDAGRFSIELDGETLYEGPFDSVEAGENLIREADEEEDGTQVPDEAQAADDLLAAGPTYELPLEPITVAAGQQLRFATTCEEVGEEQPPPLTACNETFELDGRADDAAASG